MPSRATTPLGSPILQFGTSRFLQAHVDLFVSEAAEAGHALGGITVVQTSGNPASMARMRALARGEGFDVIVRGLVRGQPIEVRSVCRSVRAAFDARTQWPAVREQMRTAVRVVVSNTGDSGWDLHVGDAAALLHEDAAAPQSFPAKLLVLLHDRWHARPAAELSLLPCELVARNGEQLREIVARLAVDWSCAPAFVDWLRGHVVWANSLVDRIVSEALDPVGAVAEPYALWAIERQPRLLLPCQHPSIVLADRWAKQGHPAQMTVLQAMQHPSMRDALESVWREEVLPVFDALGEGAGARVYLTELRDRLLNPFLAHRLADIAQNHSQKKLRRIEPLIALASRHAPALKQPHLRAIVGAS